MLAYSVKIDEFQLDGCVVITLANEVTYNHQTSHSEMDRALMQYFSVGFHRAIRCEPAPARRRSGFGQSEIFKETSPG